MDQSHNPFLAGALVAVIGVAVGAGAVISADLVSIGVNPNLAKDLRYRQSAPDQSARRNLQGTRNNVQRLREAISAGQRQTDPASLKEHSEATPPSGIGIDAETYRRVHGGAEDSVHRAASERAVRAALVNALLRRCDKYFGDGLTFELRSRRGEEVISRRELNCRDAAERGEVYRLIDA